MLRAVLATLVIVSAASAAFAQQAPFVGQPVLKEIGRNPRLDNAPPLPGGPLVEIPIERAQGLPLMRGGVKFYFGAEPGPANARKLGEAASSTAATGRCRPSFEAALVDLSAQAVKLGGDAVVAIRSDPGDPGPGSASAFVCDMTKVWLTGTIVATR